jgi:hypothetical protein
MVNNRAQSRRIAKKRIPAETRNTPMKQRIKYTASLTSLLTLLRLTLDRRICKSRQVIFAPITLFTTYPQAKIEKKIKKDSFFYQILSGLSLKKR